MVDTIRYLAHREYFKITVTGKINKNKNLCLEVRDSSWTNIFCYQNSHRGEERLGPSIIGTYSLSTIHILKKSIRNIMTNDTGISSCFDENEI